MDLLPFLKNLAQTVPFWALLMIALNHFMKKFDKSNEHWESRLSRMEKNIQDIQVSLAGASFSHMRDELEKLKERKFEADLQIKAIWRHLDAAKDTAS